MGHPGAFSRKRFERKDRNNLFKDFPTTLNPHSYHSYYKLSHERGFHLKFKVGVGNQIYEVVSKPLISPFKMTFIITYSIFI